jgi:hypothetical protein
VLFSSTEIAQFINNAFEPAWESVRPVPIVTIDFGNGTKVTRTLNGNIATYVCDAEGKVLDVMAGIYEPATFQERLDQFRLLAQYVAFRGRGRAAPNDLFQNYHVRQGAALNANKPPEVLAYNFTAGLSKAVIENPIKLIAAGEAPGPQLFGGLKPIPTPSPKGAAAEEIARWKELAEDTRLNETVRRRMVHEKLSEVGMVPPDQIVKWLYKDVLHADLDDPYLGLGETLFKNYPFAAEERNRSE